jgi:hypothetical protein
MERARAVVWGFVVASALVLASASQAVTIPAGVYTLPVAAADATTTDLNAPAPFAGFPTWVRVRPNSPTDTASDYTSDVNGVGVGTAAGTPADPWIYDITFTVSWSGEIDGAAPAQAVADQMLFTIIDSRFGAGSSLLDTVDLPQSGFVRGSFAIDGTPVTPEIVQDASAGQGFVNDIAGDRWLGFYLPANTDTHTITMQWALGQTPPVAGRPFFHNALFVAVPEPGTLLLLAAAGAGLLVARRRVGA